MNEKQFEIAEKVLVNTANVTLATLVFGGFLSSKGFDLKLFLSRSMIFIACVGWAIWLRKW